MSLRHELDRYLTVRRSLGYKLGTSERVLRRFVDFYNRKRPHTALSGRSPKHNFRNASLCD